MRDYKTEFIKCLDSIDYGKRRFAVFQDFLEISSISFENAVQMNNDREQRYFQLIKQYKNPEKFCELLALLSLTLTDNPRDFLGEVYMTTNLGNKSTSQFFTPYHISELMAEMTMSDDLNKIIEEQGFITVCEPCCGAGGMLIAASEVLKKRGYNPQEVMLFQANDIDINCCRMTYLQTSLLGLSGEVFHQNTLSFETWYRFITPMTVFNLGKYQKFKQQNKQIKTEEKTTERIIENDRKFKIEQLSLFA